MDELQIAEVIQLVLRGVTQLLFSAAFAYIHLECQFTTLWDLIRNGLNPFSLKPNLNCYRYFPYHPCSHVLGTAYIAIKVCISFLLSKDNLPPLPTCHGVLQVGLELSQLCVPHTLQSLEELGGCGLTLWTQEIGGGGSLPHAAWLGGCAGSLCAWLEQFLMGLL